MFSLVYLIIIYHSIITHPLSAQLYSTFIVASFLDLYKLALYYSYFILAISLQIALFISFSSVYLSTMYWSKD